MLGFASASLIDVERAWSLSMKRESEETWQPWKVNENGQISGYVTQFDMSSHFNDHRHGFEDGNAVVKSFRFVTVRRAGHEVPSYRPQEALEMFRRFLNDEW